MVVNSYLPSANVESEEPHQTEEEKALLHAVSVNPLVKELRSLGIAKEFRSVLAIRDEDLPNHLTCTTLAGPNKISAPPYVFADDSKGSLLAFYHLGVSLAGHAGLIHGGILASLLDECMGRACFAKLPNHIAVTARMEISFRVPVLVNNVVCIRAETENVVGRKAWVKASVEDPGSTMTMAQATALFIEPRGAADMSKMM